MDENTKYIVASNLTAAYFAGMEPQLQRPPDDPARTESQMQRPLKEVRGVYLAFVEMLNEHGTLGAVG